ncbi:protein dachsous-like isoform X3 [Lineus longissimus]|uniref:protein dachsous-like isoform X3 n=1 Tax=Lineus longissimus TaxID=88925 RepID=UPI00315D462C
MLEVKMREIRDSQRLCSEVMSSSCYCCPSASCRKMAFSISQHPGNSWLIVSLLLVLCCSGCYGADALCSFTGDKYAVVLRVREDLKVGATIGKLNLTADNSQVSLALNGPNNFVTLDSATRELKVKTEMDADKNGAAKNVKLQCTIKGNGQKVDLTALISLIDVNEHPPVFDKSVYKLEIGELTPVGTTLLTTIRATDADFNNLNILYAIQPGSQGSWNLSEILEYFNMPMPGKGILQLVKPLDYETFHNMSCLITATDHQQGVATTSGPGHLTGTATLQITIKDGDNRNPIFVGEPNTGRIQASASQGALVTMDKAIKAIDGDSGINEKVLYKVPGVAGVTSYFTIDPNSGALKLNKVGPPAGQNVVTVQAYQKNSPLLRSTTTRVVVTVQGTNSVPPSFSQQTYTAQALENSPVGASLLTVVATDKDQVYLGINGSILSYALSGTNVFGIDTKSGVIFLAMALDFETMAIYTFEAKVKDGTFTSTATVSVTVLDVNDNDPVFSELAYTFKYDDENGDKVLGKVTATDKDKNNKVTLSLRDYKHIFSINQAGELRMIGKKGDITQSKYELLIDAVDDGVPPRRATGVAVVSFSPAMVAGAVAGGGTVTEVDLIPLIILACLCGVLIIVIIGLIIYIHKRGGCCPREPRHTGIFYINDERKSKNRRSNKENNLMYYSNNSSMNEEDGHTSVQTNPLALNNPGYYTLENGIPGENDPRYGSERQISEIQLDTAVTPLGHINSGSFKSDGSGSSYEPHKSGMSTFRTNHPKSKKFRNNRDRVEVYNAENAIERDSHHADGEKPGITVYF